MGRPIRVFAENTVYHITSRTLNREDIFIDDNEFEKLISLLKEYAEKSKNEIIAYTILNDHLHIMVRQSADPEAWSISQMIQTIKAQYSKWYNKTHGRAGTLYQERFHADAVTDIRYLLACVRYIHNNPVKAGMVAKAADYKWSSYADYMSALAERDENGEYPEKHEFVTCKPVLDELGGGFEAFMNEGINQTAENRTGEEIYDYDRKKAYRCDSLIAEHIKKEYEIDAKQVINLTDEAKRQLLDYMHIDENVSLAQLSRVVGITVFKLQRILSGGKISAHGYVNVSKPNSRRQMRE